jgi:hypothetical protein
MPKLVAAALLLIITPVAAAHALSLSFGTFYSIQLLSGVNENGEIVDAVTLSSQSIVTDLRTLGSGTGTASASYRNRSNSVTTDVAIDLGPGPGTAFARSFSVTSFEVLFPEPGLYLLGTEIQVYGQPDLNPRPGEAAYLFRNYILESSDPNAEIFEGTGDTRLLTCPGKLCDTSFVFDSFQQLSGIPYIPGPDLTLPLTLTINFELSATAVPEPSTFALATLGFLMLIYICSLADQRFCNRSMALPGSRREVRDPDNMQPGQTAAPSKFI